MEEKKTKQIHVEMSASDENGTDAFDGDGVMCFVFSEEGVHAIYNGRVQYLDMAYALRDAGDSFDKLLRAMRIVDAERNVGSMDKILRDALENMIAGRKKEKAPMAEDAEEGGVLQ